MSYCTSTDITAAVSNEDLVQLTNNYGGDAIIDSVIAGAIDFADNEIDGYLRSRYNLPLSSTPGELKYIAVDITVYRLYSLRTFAPVPENIRERFDDALKKLYQIQKGQFNLGIEGTDEHANKLMKINKGDTGISTEKYYDKEMWDKHDIWEGYS